jgi:hypothetical protein
VTAPPALAVAPLGDRRYRVSGGAAPHVVTIDATAASGGEGISQTASVLRQFPRVSG